MFMRTIAVSTVLAVCVAPVHASWLYCKINAAECLPIQGSLMPFDKAEMLIENCRALTRNNIGATAMKMSMEKVMKTANSDINHPLLRAQLAYLALHDSQLKFDRTIGIEQRYPHVRLACAQAFADYNR